MTDTNTEQQMVEELKRQRIEQSVRPHKKWYKIWMVLTGLLITTVVGIPIALFTGLMALKHSRAVTKIEADV